MVPFQDRAQILLEDIKTHVGGYKIIRSKIARTGVQTYRAHELGDEYVKHGYAKNDLVQVYRDPSEVFSDAAVNGWAGVPVTKGHPPELVTPDNVGKYQVGNVRDKAHVDMAAGWLGLEYMLQDAAAIHDFDSGAFAEVSGGYEAGVAWGDGVTPDGTKYQARQVNIKPNHLALVPAGRAFVDGTSRIGDADNWGASPVTTKEPSMDFTKVVIGDKAVSVATSDADIFTKIIADKDTAIGELKGALAEAEAKILTPEQLTAKVTELADAAMRKEAVKAKFGDEAIKDASDAEIAGMYRVLDKTAKPVNDAARTVLTDMKPAAGKSAWDKFLPADKKGAK